MPNYFFPAAVLCLVLISSGISQETVYLPSEPVWNNPYPGLGNVAPSTATPALPSTILYADPAGTTADSELSPTIKSGDLYLSRIPNNKRTGMFQKANFNALWAADTGGINGLGVTELDLSAVFALPMPTPESPFVFTPSFKSTFFDTKTGSETFYTTGLDMRWIRPLVKNKLTADLGFGVFYCGDFHTKASDAVRLPAHAAGIWNFNPRTKIVFGVAYLDRSDSYNWLPMGGVIWTPNDEVSVELIFPRLRLARRVHWFASAEGDDRSDWIYTAFEFGGGSWGYENVGRLDYRDIRLLLGCERRMRSGLTLGLELGYMFERKIEINGTNSSSPSDTVFLRLRTSF
jgi:hypothetical protein